MLGRFVLGYAHVRIKADAETLAEAAEPDFEESVPMHTASLLWSRGFGSGITTSLGAYFVDDMKWLNDGDDQPAHWRYDMKVAKRLGKQGSSDEIAFTVQSLGGRYDQFRMGEYSFERRAFVTLRLGW
ncbi:MAG: hypothetical protein EP309_01000 [Gammaproteobacteria bacterium]|nr:MAG: hypothetical protein EP309_01000 [Gammaproteobacteria bacterium]